MPSTSATRARSSTRLQASSAGNGVIERARRRLSWKVRRMQAAVPAGASPNAPSPNEARPAAVLGGKTLVLGVAVAVLLVLVGYPMLWLLLGAFGLPQEFSFEHVQRAFTRPQNFAALLNTLELA